MFFLYCLILIYHFLFSYCSLFSLFDAKVPSSQRSSGFHISDILNLENSELKHSPLVHPAAHNTTDITNHNTDSNSNHLTVAPSNGDSTHLPAPPQSHTTLLDHTNGSAANVTAVSAAAATATAQAQAAAQFIANHNAAAAVAAAGQYLPKNFPNGFNDDMSSYHIAHTMLTHSGRSPWIKENDLYGKFRN